MAARDTEARVKVRHCLFCRRVRRPRAGGTGTPVAAVRVAACARAPGAARGRAGGTCGHPRTPLRRRLGVMPALLTPPPRARQAPTDIEGQLAELQRKFRILEARAATRGGAEVTPTR